MKSAERIALYGQGKEYRRRLLADVVRDRWLYLLLLPGFIYFILFKYVPMWGVVIAFENYVPYDGVFGSQWVGLKWFQYFFSMLTSHHFTSRLPSSTKYRPCL